MKLRESSDESLTIEVKDGSVVVVPNDIDLLTPYVLLEQEDWFEDEVSFVRTYLRPGMRVVDIGANYGVYSLLAARAVGEQGVVWAVEPGEKAATYLRRSKDANGDTGLHIVDAALSRSTGQIDFYESAGAESNSVVYQQDTHVSTRKVQSYALDDAARECGWNAIDFIKLDAEGEELNILDSGARFFADESPLIMYEFKTINEVFNVALIKKFKALGYRTFRLVPGLGVLVPLVAGDKVDLFQLNLFCCKPDRQAELISRGLLTEHDSGRAMPLDLDGAMSAHFTTLPYAQRYLSRQLSGAGTAFGVDDLIYREGLGLFAHSRSRADFAARVHFLNLALHRVNDAIAQRDTLWRNISAARIMLDLGLRERAARLLKAQSDRISQGVDTATREPFLAASSRYDEPAKDLSLTDYVAISVNEQLERSRAYSSFFTRDSTLVVLKRAGNLDLLSMDMIRRIALISRRQNQPWPTSLDTRLTVTSPEHINAHLWR